MILFFLLVDLFLYLPERKGTLPLKLRVSLALIAGGKCGGIGWLISMKEGNLALVSYWRAVKVSMVSSHVTFLRRKE